MKIYADIIMIVHLIWVLFMILGLPLGLWLRSTTLRWIHAGGMAITAFFAATGIYCPLTTWEEALRLNTDPGFGHEGSFLARYLSAALYPQAEPWILRIITILWGLLTFWGMIVIKPGRNFKR